MMRPMSVQIYLITPPEFDAQDFRPQFIEALEAGPVACVQLRMKSKDGVPAPRDEVRRAAEVLMPEAQSRDVAFLINDDAELAAEIGADGVHVGQDDMSAKQARAIVGKDAIVGVTCHNSRHLAIEAAGDNVINLDCLFELLCDSQYTDYARQVREQLIKILEDKHKNGTSNDVDYKLLGSYYGRIGKIEAAIECYQRALQYRYDNFRWRYDLARLLFDCGRTKEAMEQARICLRLNPKFTAAKTLLAECSVHPAVLQAAANQ